MLLAALVCGVTLAALLELSGTLLPIFAAGATYRWPGDFPLLLAWIAGVATLGGVVYAGVAAWLRLPELAAFLGRGRGVLDRVTAKIRRRPPPAVPH